MRPTLIIRRSDGTERARIDADTAAATRVRREMDRCEVTVPAAEWLAVDADARTDRLTVERPDDSVLFGGRLDDSTRDAGSVTATVVSYERDAKDAEPTSANLTYQNTSDSTIITDALSAVPTLSAGTVDTLASSLSYSFANAARSKQVREPTQATGGSVRYNADGSVDYQQRFGADRSEVLSPASQHVVGTPRVVRDARDEVTHVRAFGGGQGPNQLQATAVADSYSAGSRQVWREHEDPNIKEQDRLDAIAQRLATEFDGTPRKLTVETSIVGVDVDRGDTFPVELPDRGVDERLEVVRVVERFGSDGRVQEVTLTSRTADEDAESSTRQLTQEFGRGYRGFVDRNQTTSGWNPAGDGVPQTLDIPNWPDDIVTAQTVELTVQGRAWRSPVTATGHTHSVDVTHPSHDHSISTTSLSNSDIESISSTEDTQFFVDLDDTTWKEVASIQPSEKTSGVWGTATFAPDSNELTEFHIRLRNKSTGFTFPITSNFDSGNSVLVDADSSFWPSYSFVGVDKTDCQGEEVVIEVRAYTQGDSGDTLSYQAAMFASGRHDHEISDTSTAALGTTNSETSDSSTDFSPQIIDSFDGTSYYPSSVEISVNGSTVTTLSGDGAASWQATVDLVGELNPGLNTIRALPTGERGALNLILSSELFRRGRST